MSSRRHGCHQYLAGVDAGARLQVADPERRRELGPQPHDVLDHFHPRGQRIAARGLLGDGIAEVGHGAIALELRDDTSMSGDDGGDPVLVGTQHVVPVLRIERGGEIRRPDEIGEHHRQLTPLGPVGRHGHAAAPVAERDGQPPGPHRSRTGQIYVHPGRSDSADRQDVQSPFGVRRGDRATEERPAASVPAEDDR